MSTTKVLYLVRHGQAFHNVEGEIFHQIQQRSTWGIFLNGKWMKLRPHHILRVLRCLWLIVNTFLSPAPKSLVPVYYEHADASLTPVGWEQVHKLHRELDNSGLRNRVGLVVVSPLTRTLQTAAGVFGGGKVTTVSSDPLLMAANVGRCPQPAISGSSSPPFIAMEKCRERMSHMPCDGRSSRSTCERQFPGIDFSEIEHESDELWKAERGETEEKLYKRTLEFAEWIANREESEIAVVSHGGFLTNFVEKFGDETVNKTQFDHCEPRTVILRKIATDSGYTFQLSS